MCQQRDEEPHRSNLPGQDLGMKVRIVSPSPPPNAFERFAVQIDIEDQDQLIALTMAASRMGNGHGNRLYDLLERKCAERGVIVG